ncbi:fumarylacetoacetate hydrolase family protein [Paeniglutamicibacter sp. ZC-3]|uniref:fumarylacetoacetate hydrolase family protein n=1 Tax=Paeniglutamicibacter sp. ZC-3 TaxID=2986919 RepID=UPI0021F7DE59|nr:fumarylacetoacetate hydrolase family protein [Paeniglutamicibacter sp. ZC-3]MCV9994790.1 fumarylacetoacetate hydrolase family protein [Paeniglutamicibacter sp. ZC-3]
MKLATIRHAGSTTAALVVGDAYQPLPAGNLSDLLGMPAWKQIVSEAASEHPGLAVVPASDVEVLNPVPTPAKVICCGLNYSDHILEMGRDLPAYPTLFAKFADTLTDPDAQIVADESVDLDWEAELAVVVGTTLQNAGEDEAAAAIAGYTVANDISMRDWQRRTLQWFQGKAFDRTTPLGPVMVTADEINPEAGLEVICTLNGTEVQRGNTKTLVFSAAKLLAYISTFTILRPGDVVLTGTPGGVGMGMTPPLFLKDGDELITEIPGIGTLRNIVRTRVTAAL